MEKRCSSSRPSLVYCFEQFQLDPARFELREHGHAKHLEPQVLSLLILLVSNADRLVGKDELVEKIWSGRAISDAAIASCIKAARAALRDDGKQQRLVRTIHGKGLRFVGQIAYEDAEEPRYNAVEAPGLPSADPPQPERPSIAVLPFELVGDFGPLSFVADALADEIIADLSRLRWLLVIARASTFRFRNQRVRWDEIGSLLGVRYCLTGALEAGADWVILSVELARTSDHALVWAERFKIGRDELQSFRREMIAIILSNLEVRIARQEVEQARRASPTMLSAWSAYHLGLDHMFRFNKADNKQAASLFEKALSLDPGFSRALSGMSFTCFQDSFLQYSDAGRAMAQRARTFAELALQADPLDPFAHLNFGRSLWFVDAVPESIERLGTCIALSPNYAQAIYSKAWAEMTQCDLANSDANAALALRLSPLDPLRYAMLAVRSVSAFLNEDYASAADFGESAAHSAGAHKHIALIAAIAAHAAARPERAARWVSRARALDANVSPATFFASFPFVASAGRERIDKALHDLGI